MDRCLNSLHAHIPWCTSPILTEQSAGHAYRRDACYKRRSCCMKRSRIDSSAAHRAIKVQVSCLWTTQDSDFGLCADIRLPIFLHEMSLCRNLLMVREDRILLYKRGYYGADSAMTAASKPWASLPITWYILLLCTAALSCFASASHI